MSNVFVIIKMCYVHSQWYDISCATLFVMMTMMIIVVIMYVCNRPLGMSTRGCADGLEPASFKDLTEV